MKRVFVDGGSGTTGLRIKERLSGIDGIELVSIPDEKRRDPEERRRAIFRSDVVFLCLPDDAAREAAALAEGSDAVIIDTSTAHRTADGWVYGMAELSPEQRSAVASSKRTANPGCHASGFIALAAPLVGAGIIPGSARLSATSVTGYSGGGKKMIAEYESADRPLLYGAPRLYGTGQAHKHLPEMKKYSRLDVPPVFEPIVADFYSGMLVTVPLPADDLSPGFTVSDVIDCYREKYAGPVVKYLPPDDPLFGGGYVSAAALSGFDSMAVTVFGKEDRIVLAALFDNLGKGASGSAIQCMNIALGRRETDSLNLL
ncbi:MAG: N-acetyl-gamma-glutamyl-phosphate reductase [Clostridia bacterium]|nr:N-acetyl-gamma-glutamyl-phosphate reductase [Clostridia bacterium]